MDEKDFQAEECFYGTSTPKKTKNSHTGWIIAACLFVIAACTLQIVMSLFRPGGDPRRAQWNDLQTDASGSQNDSRIVVSAEDFGSIRVPVLTLGGSNRTAGSADDIQSRVSPSLCTVTVGFADRTVECTGVFFTADGYLLAACGDLRDAIEITVTAAGQQNAPCWIGSDEQTGLALLKLTAADRDCQPAVFTGLSGAQAGDPVLTVSAAGETAQGVLVRTAAEQTPLQSSAKALPNGAGAALVNESGDVLGLALEAEDGQDGTSAVPSEALPDALSRILDANPAAQLWLQGDVGEIPALFIKYYHYPGTLWFRSYAGSGLCEHDIILEADGKAVATVEELNAAVAAHTVGDTVTLTVYREGKTYTALLPVCGR